MSNVSAQSGSSNQRGWVTKENKTNGQGQIMYKTKRLTVSQVDEERDGRRTKGLYEDEEYLNLLWREGLVDSSRPCLPRLGV